ncbi:protein FAR1-RELATED SEQUENCE 5-like [Abrus precatorius]|uniref:Protein FAR1-RELATED SEQUENCE 5-like n=1 Tax=Abrus precatorius TaxID=3816 RepID=A0A8B8KDA9_ABRPR|nr:protein FAR1-RELATED SEQUENCE 5-like [Abrus precatorius]
MDVPTKPSVGLEFESLEQVWKFWCEYGRLTGFGVRKQYFNKRKRDGVITGCRYFVEKHNHPLQLPETTHMLEASRLRQKASLQLMSTLVGHQANVGYTRLDAKNYLKAKRQREMVYGEVGCRMQYFQQQLLDNPSFFHAYQMDAEEQITNVFWAVAKMRNHFNGCSRHSWKHTTTKKPQTFFTDQDQAMAKALVQVMPETRHALCTWHVIQNGIKHLGNLMKGGSHLLRDLKRCIYDFEKAWIRLITEYNVQEHTWITSLYAIKEKWASCYLKDYLTLGMHSTQLSESLNSDFKACMNPGVDINCTGKGINSVPPIGKGNRVPIRHTRPGTPRQD